ncbi:MAG TPA: hypothetical protein VIM62_06205, partial [Acidobacteriaceae bacterium]
MNLEQYSGTAKAQQQTVVSNPTCFTTTAQPDPQTFFANCGTANLKSPQIDTLSSGYRSPYTEQLGASLERQISRTATLTFTYLHSFGVHQLVVRDANAYLPGTYQFGSDTLTGTRPDSNLGIVDQYFPEAVFKQNQIIVNLRAQISPRLSLMGFYNWTDANSNGGAASNPSNSYNLNQDYGRAAFVRPQMLFLMGNYNGPWGLTFNPFLVVQSGRPFNITTNNDLTGDNFFNNRPAFAGSGDCAATAGPSPSQYVLTSIGCLDTIPTADETLVKPNTMWGPSTVAVNLRASRSWGIGPKVEQSGGPQRQGGGFGGGPGGGGGHGGGGRGGGFGGFGGGFGGPGGGGRGGMQGTGRKYSLTFSAQALNLFNDINLGTPSGSIAPSYDQATGVTGPGSRFDVSNHLASGLFASPSGSAARRIFVQAAFSF